VAVPRRARIPLRHCATWPWECRAIAVDERTSPPAVDCGVFSTRGFDKSLPAWQQRTPWRASASEGGSSEEGDANARFRPRWLGQDLALWKRSWRACGASQKREGILHLKGQAEQQCNAYQTRRGALGSLVDGFLAHIKHALDVLYRSGSHKLVNLTTTNY
jgi:hypothetical protein